MFKVHQKQHAAVAERAFVERLENHVAEDILRRRVSAEERSRLPIRAMVEHGLVVARTYGLETERDLMLFVLNMITINPEWHHHPKINAILTDSTLSRPARREKLLTDVTDDEWEEAGVMVDEDEYWSRALPAS